MASMSMFFLNFKMIFIYFKVQCTFSNLSSLAWLPVDHILRNSLISACRRLSVTCWLCSRSTVHIKLSIKKNFPHQPGIISIILEDIKLVLLYFLMFPQWFHNISPTQHFILSHEVDILYEDFLIHVADFEWSWLGLLIIPFGCWNL